MARPSEYDPAYAIQAEKLCKLGATNAELADFFEVSDRTILRWQTQFPEFCRALKVGKELADERVESSLYHKAIGYTFDAEKVFQFQGEIVRTDTREHVPPDTTACIFWLKNRRPDLWRDRQDFTVKRDFEEMSDHEVMQTLAQVQRLKAPDKTPEKPTNGGSGRLQ